VIQRIKDLILEFRICRALEKRHYEAAFRMIGQRSPEQVARMERGRGLA
jgi:hypothetical protein